MTRILLFTAAAYLGLLLALYLLQRSFIYYPTQSTSSPADAGVPEMQEIELTTEDNLNLRAWYRPAGALQPTIVYFHGNAGNIADRGLIVRPFLDQGYGVLLLTYRGYSGNPGSPDEQGLYKDARAALEFVEKQGVPGECLVLYGNSIGSAVALQMATERRIGALILQAPFSSLVDVAKIHYAFFLPFPPLIKDKYNSLSKAGRIDCPVLILHGKNDRIIPPELSRKLLAKLPHPKQAAYIPGKGHNDLFEPERVDTFIQQNVRCAFSGM